MCADYAARIAEAKGNLKKALKNKAREFPNELDEIDGVDIPKPDDGLAAWDEEAIPGAVDALVDGLLESWERLPEPSKFDAKLAAAKSVKQMTMQEGTDEISDVKEGLTVDLNIPSTMTAIQANVEAWNGATLTEFRKNYSNRFDYMLFFHGNTAAALELTMEAHKEMYRTTEDCVVSAVNKAADAVDAVTWAGDEADASTFLNVLSVTLGIVASVATGPVGAIAGVTAGLSGLGGMKAEADAADANAMEFGAGRISEVWQNLVSALIKIDTELEASRDAINKALLAVWTSLTSLVNVGSDGEGGDVNVYSGSLMRPPVPGAVSKDKVLKHVRPPDAY